MDFCTITSKDFGQQKVTGNLLAKAALGLRNLLAKAAKSLLIN
jgi:hypothetical protein